MRAKLETFSEWMARVNKTLELRAGLTSEDLPDCPYRDWYQYGMTSHAAAAAVMCRLTEVSNENCKH